MKPFFITIPHAGEIVPAEAFWLKGLPENILFCDSDRYVDVLYKPALDELRIPNIVATCHRYVVDLNRLPDDVDADSVEDCPIKSGTHPKGYHWSVTTKGNRLINKPISDRLHKELTDKYFFPFHKQIQMKFAEFFKEGNKSVYHLDAHSMPSVGEALHVDPGQQRADIVISDRKGVSCKKEFLDLVVSAYENAGFGIKVNFPYVGGRITEAYGLPNIGQHTIQVEMNRRLYMDENTKKLKNDLYPEVQKKIVSAIKYIYEKLPQN
jgi:N-formylglutamate deformylase